jgi:hypothetical protein
MMAVFDEYNPDDRCAKQVEQNIFTLSTTRMSSQRRLYEEDSVDVFRRASLMLTTVDKNRGYIRSSKGAGERRFITLEVEGVRDWYGAKTSNREVITECALPLLVYGYQLYMEGDKGSATEYSMLTTGEYISEASIIAKIAARWSLGDIKLKLEDYKKMLYREGSDDYRFSMAQMQALLLPEDKLGRLEVGDLRTMIEDLGAENIGKARVNVANGKEAQKDNAYVIKDWDEFMDHLVAKM